MADYLALVKGTDDVSEVVNFDAERIFNLIGTNPADYLVAKGLSSWAVGEQSDGLVRTKTRRPLAARVTTQSFNLHERTPIAATPVTMAS